MAPTVVLRAGRENPLQLGHPWVYSGAVGCHDAAPGSIVEVLDHRGGFLARGMFNPDSQIQVRVLSRDQDKSIDDRFWQRRLEQSIRRRDESVVPGGTTAMRLVFAESDGLPGLIVDRYGDWLVLQAVTLGIDGLKTRLARWLVELTAVRGVYERSDDQMRRLEGLEPARGTLAGQEPPPRLMIEEAGLRFWVDVLSGQKTGFYLDQRENRQLVRRLAADRRVLNVFGYTGAFTIAAIAGGAGDTLTVESSQAAVDLALENMALNGYADRPAVDSFLVGDAFSELGQLAREGRHFDLVILDPPRFARSAAHRGSAVRAYRAINRLGFQLVEPGGVLVTFSCSGLISPESFFQIVSQAAAQAGVAAQVVGRLGQAADHPVALGFPEAAYLKGLVCRVTGGPPASQPAGGPPSSGRVNP